MILIFFTPDLATADNTWLYFRKILKGVPSNATYTHNNDKRVLNFVLSFFPKELGISYKLFFHNFLIFLALMCSNK